MLSLEELLARSPGVCAQTLDRAQIRAALSGRIYRKRAIWIYGCWWMVEKSQPCLLDKREEWSGNSNWPQPVELKALTCKSKATSVESNQVQVPLDRSGLEFTLHGPYTRTQVTGLGLGLRLGRGLGFGLGLDRGYGLRLGLGLGLGLQWAAKVGSTRQFMAHINNPLGSLLFIWLSPGQLCNARINK